MSTFKIPARPKLPLNKHGREPLVYCKLDVVKGGSLLHLRSRALSELLYKVAEHEPREVFIDTGNFPVLVFPASDQDIEVDYENDNLDANYRVRAFNFDYNYSVMGAFNALSNIGEWKATQGIRYQGSHPILRDNRINVRYFLADGLAEGLNYWLRFPVPGPLAQDIVRAVTLTAKALINSFPTEGTIESSLYAEGAA